MKKYDFLILKESLNLETKKYYALQDSTASATITLL